MDAQSLQFLVKMVATTRSSDEYGEGTRQTPNNRVIDFTTRDHDNNLSPLRLIENPMSDISAGLDRYLSVLNRGGSIALGRGERLTSTRLGKSIESLFSTATPRVIEGPLLNWAMLILLAGPHFDGPSQLKLGESHVELPEDDLELVRSGRPWRFLSPWPDQDDCEKELRSTEVALRELVDTRQIMKKRGHPNHPS